MMKFISVIFLSIGISCNLWAQKNQFYKIQRLPFFVNGQEVPNPLGGNWGNPGFSEIDLNNDGIKDLYVFDRYNNRSLTFINKKTGKYPYQYQEKYEKYFPKDLQNWVLLRDYNCDGLEDIFSYASGGLKIHRAKREKDSSISFTLAHSTPIVYSKNYSTWGGDVNIWVSYTDVPIIEDIDGDGDMDIITLFLSENSVSLFTAMNKEYKLPCDSVIYEYPTRCWGKFSMTFMPLDFNKGACGGDTVDKKTSIGNTNGRLRHGGNTFWAYDEEKDGVYEIMVGDVTYNYAVYGKNSGKKNFGNITSSSKTWPPNTKPINHLCPMGYWLDVNNDGKKDMIITEHEQSLNASKKRATLYKNIPAGDTSKFFYESDDFLISSILDFGRNARPVFFDYNNDTLLDLVVSNDFNLDTPGYLHASFHLFKNIGTKTKPQFKLIDTNYADIKTLWHYNAQPTFGDLDGDGNKDMIIGTSSGGIHFAKNNIVNQESTFPNIQQNYITIQNLENASPFLYDLNSDGKLDLIIGDKNGRVLYLPNTGTKTNPIFDTSKINKTLGNIFVEDTLNQRKFNLMAAPTIAKIDSNPPYLMVSNKSGMIFLFEINKDSLNKGTFKIITNDLISNRFKEEINITTGDLNNDQLTDFMIGNESGGLNLYSLGIFDSTEIDTVTVDPTKITSISGEQSVYKANIYPNPSHDKITIHFDNPVDQFDVQIINAMGSVIELLQNIQNDGTIDLSNFSKGVYHVLIQNSNFKICEKIIKLE